MLRSIGLLQPQPLRINFVWSNITSHSATCFSRYIRVYGMHFHWIFDNKKEWLSGRIICRKYYGVSQLKFQLSFINDVIIPEIILQLQPVRTSDVSFLYSLAILWASTVFKNVESIYHLSRNANCSVQVWNTSFEIGTEKISIETSRPLRKILSVTCAPKQKT
jgi:hypothetical protein